MPLFRVTLYINAVKDVNNEDIEREARDEKEAAEMVSGEELIEKGNAGQYRAQVRPVSSLGKMTPFWSLPKNISN